MKLVIPKGSTSRIITVFIEDSSSTTGAGLGSLTNASSIVGGFVREGSTGVALAVNEDVTTEGTYQAPTTEGQVRIGTPANMRTGTYELHFHNNLWATGAETVTITLGGASNMAPLNIEVQLSDPVRGLGSPTALPNAAADAAGGLPISDAGELDLDAKIGALTFTVAGDVDVNVQSWKGSAAPDNTGDSFAIVNSGTHGNAALKTLIDTVETYVDTEIGALTTELAKVPKSDGTATWNATALASIQSEGNDALVAFFTSAAALVDNIWDEVIDTSAHNGADSAGQKLRRASSKFLAEGTVNPTGATTTSFRTDLTEDDDHWNDALLTFISGDLAGQSRTILDYANVDGLITLDEALTSIPAGGVKFIIESTHIHPVTQVATAVWANGTRTLTAIDEDSTTLDLDAAIRAALGMASASYDTDLSGLNTKLDTIDNFVDTEIGGLQTTLNSLFTTALTESYNTDGAAPTVAQALMGIYQTLTEGAISGTGWTVNRLDGTTPAFGLTLDSATTPTTKTRSS